MENTALITAILVEGQNCIDADKERLLEVVVELEDDEIDGFLKGLDVCVGLIGMTIMRGLVSLSQEVAEGDTLSAFFIVDEPEDRISELAKICHAMGKDVQMNVEGLQEDLIMR